jgi:hypothetical protein
MRGRDKIAKELSISGNSFYMYLHEEEIKLAKKGDVAFFSVLETKATDPWRTFETSGFKGYLKAKISDGKEWNHINLAEIFEFRENFFSKQDIPLNVYYLCSELIKLQKGLKLYKTYRDHYSIYQYEREGYKGRKDKFK